MYLKCKGAGKIVLWVPLDFFCIVPHRRGGKSGHNITIGNNEIVKIIEVTNNIIAEQG